MRYPERLESREKHQGGKESKAEIDFKMNLNKGRVI